MKCELCDETRSLDRSHIVPRRITRYIHDIDNQRCFTLCATHHRCYDHFLLTRDELAVLWPEIQQAVDNVIALAKAATPRSKTPSAKGSLKDMQLQSRLWLEKWEKFLS